MSHESIFCWGCLIAQLVMVADMTRRYLKLRRFNRDIQNMRRR